MQRARNDFLTRAILTGNQNVSIRRADARDEFHNRLHGRRLGDKPDRSGAPISAVTQRQVFGFETLTAPQRCREFYLSPQH